MIKSKNLFLYEAIALLLIFTIVYFLAANKLSYAFAYDESKALYESKINLITNSAVIYGESNLDLFAEKDTIYLTVNDLVSVGALLADNDSGEIKDPTSDVKTFNEKKVRISLKNGKVEAKILK